ncbi:hypothetical protein OG937_08860 [Streptomyces sp. NBC_00510]
MRRGLPGPALQGVKDALEEHLTGDTRFTFLGKEAHPAFPRAS